MSAFFDFGFTEFVDQSFGRIFTLLGLSDLYAIIQMLFKTFADSYLPKVNEFGMVRHLWMPEPFVEGFPPLRYSVPAGPHFLPSIIDRFFIEHNLYLQDGFMKQWLYIKAWVVLTALYYQKLVNIRFSLGFILQVNPYVPPLSGLWFITDWGINALSGFIPISRGMDFNPLLFSGLLGYFIDSTRTLTYALPYTKEDLKISASYGRQLAAVTGNERRRFMQVVPVGEKTTDQNLFKYYFEGIPSYYLKTKTDLPEGLLKEYWFESINGPAIVRYLLDTYPDVDIRPQFLRDRQVDEFLLKYDPLMKGQSLEPIKDKYYYYDIKDEHLPLIREVLDRWAIDKKIPINEQTIMIGRQKKMEYAIEEKKAELLNTIPLKDVKELFKLINGKNPKDALKTIDKETYERLFPNVLERKNLTSSNSIETQTLPKLLEENSLNYLTKTNSENLNISELLSLTNLDSSVYTIYQNLDNEMSHSFKLFFSSFHF